MLIPHPLLGLRDSAEFTYLGDVTLMDRPAPSAGLQATHDYLYLRDNPVGAHRELWYHALGDRSWLVVTRDTVTQEITGAELARDVAVERARS